MKFTDIVEELQKTEKRIILARCGVFMVAIGRDALFLNKTFGLKLSCLKPGICKIGIPLNYIFKYLDELEELGYGYLLYEIGKILGGLIKSYGKNNKKYV